jgi:hypothetical protein
MHGFFCMPVFHWVPKGNGADGHSELNFACSCQSFLIPKFLLAEWITFVEIGNPKPSSTMKFRVMITWNEKMKIYGQAPGSILADLSGKNVCINPAPLLDFICIMKKRQSSVEFMTFICLSWFVVNEFHTALVNAGDLAPLILSADGKYVASAWWIYVLYTVYEVVGKSDYLIALLKHVADKKRWRNLYRAKTGMQLGGSTKKLNWRWIDQKWRGICLNGNPMVPRINEFFKRTELKEENSTRWRYIN